MSRVRPPRCGASPSLTARSAASVLAGALALGALAGCEEETVFESDARLDPPTVLAFGPTNVASEKTLAISVFNPGNAGLTLVDFNVTGSDKFIVVPDDQLLDQVPPGGTSTITVTYRPCPAAWSNDRPDPNADLTQCPGELEAAQLVLTDNTPDQTRTLSLSGQPVQPPNADFRCAQGDGQCNMPNATRSMCTALSFGNVVAGSGSSCDLYVEIANTNRSDGSGNDVPVAPLIVERAEVLVRNISASDMAQARDEEAGFSLLDESGDELSFPFEIAVPDGQSRGARVIRVRFNGQSGDWIGSQANNLGLRLFTNDPVNPVRTILVTASGSSPDIEVVPSLIDFGPVEQNTTATATISIRNEGNADLQITSAMLQQANPELVFTAADNMPIPRTLSGFGGRFDVYVSYTPSDPTNDRVFWDIASNDPDEGTFSVEIRGGPTPQFCVEPRLGVLEFPIPSPPTGMPRTENVTLQSCGSGNLRITSLDIQNAGNPESVDDFSIDLPGCETLPCSPNIELCPQNEPGCTINGMMPGIQEVVPVVYENDDTSTQDLANLIIGTTDPSLPEANITLDASDNPCLPPNGLGIVVVSPATPCVPSPVVLEVTGNPGGPVGGNATFTSCDWNLEFAPQTPNIFVPDDVPEACAMTQFVPVAPGGLHLVSVTVTNSCGKQASTPAEQIGVAANCN